MIDTETKYVGVVKFINTSWGFITPDGGGKDMFVHITAVIAAGIRELSEGDRVSYTVEIDQRGGRSCAANLKLI